MKISNFARGPTYTAFSGLVRLIEIQPSRPLSALLQLVEFPSRTPPYVALSHRWPWVEQFKTTKENLETYKKSIPFNLLPKTFKDAVLVTQAFDVRHLWIDSICIVQNDPQDWKIQSEQIGSIYEKSICTLAAIDAHVHAGRDEGLFQDRDFLPVTINLTSKYDHSYNERSSDPREPAQVIYKLNGEIIDVHTRSLSEWDNCTYQITPEHTTFTMSVELSEWGSRAWIFQERVLSSRIVYFSKEQLFWECAETVLSEHNPENSETRERFHRALRSPDDLEAEISSVRDEPGYGSPFNDLWLEHQKFKVWWVLAEQYSQCELTFSSDKWFAISGLCKVLQSRFQSGIHAGIWDSAVGAGLLWHVRDEARTPYDAFQAPSWSWLGMKGAIKYIYADESYLGQIQKVTTLLSEPRFSINQLNQQPGMSGFIGTLEFTCPACTVKLSSHKLKDLVFCETTGRYGTDPRAWKFFHDMSHGRSQLELTREHRLFDLPNRTHHLLTDNGRMIGWAIMDSDGPHSSDLECAAVALRVLKDYKNTVQHVVECVIVERDRSEDSYWRVGRGRVVELGWINNCSMKVLKVK
jgi:hypothetical protein